jgi:hypothetical protein
MIRKLFGQPTTRLGEFMIVMLARIHVAQAPFGLIRR